MMSPLEKIGGDGVRTSSAPVFLIVLLAVFGLTACGERGPESRPEPATEWQGGRIDRAATATDLRMSVTISPGGTAELMNVPGGRWKRTDSGICWDESEDVYSGAATWSWFSDSGIEVRFEDSAVIFWAWPGKFGSYDWSELKMVNCRGDRTWGMSLSCGSAGTDDMPPCRAE